MTETIICYDIRDPRRLGRIHRFLARHALALQYSVFLFSGTDTKLQYCLDELARLMDPAQDDIRAYPLPQRGYRWNFGLLPLPDGVHLEGLPAPWQPADAAPAPAIPTII